VGSLSGVASVGTQRQLNCVQERYNLRRGFTSIHHLFHRVRFDVPLAVTTEFFSV
jgi:hypothetical protein